MDPNQDMLVCNGSTSDPVDSVCTSVCNGGDEQLSKKGQWHQGKRKRKKNGSTSNPVGALCTSACSDRGEQLPKKGRQSHQEDVLHCDSHLTNPDMQVSNGSASDPVGSVCVSVCNGRGDQLHQGVLHDGHQTSAGALKDSDQHDTSPVVLDSNGCTSDPEIHDNDHQSSPEDVLHYDSHQTNPDILPVVSNCSASDPVGSVCVSVYNEKGDQLHQENFALTDVLIISDDKSWKEFMLSYLKKNRPNLKCISDKDWICCRLKMENLINSTERSKLVVIGFTVNPETDYSKYAAHSVVEGMLEAKTLDDTRLILVKLENAEIPSCFRAITAANASDDNFLPALLEIVDKCDVKNTPFEEKLKEIIVRGLRKHGMKEEQVAEFSKDWSLNFEEDCDSTVVSNENENDICIVSADSEWETEVCKMLRKERSGRSKLNVISLHELFSTFDCVVAMETFMKCVYTSKKVVVGFGTKDNGYPNNIATVVFNKLCAENKHFEQLIPVKLSTDAILGETVKYLKPLDGSLDGDVVENILKTLDVHHLKLKVSSKNKNSENFATIEDQLKEYVIDFRDRDNPILIRLKDYFSEKGLTLNGITIGCIILHLSAPDAKTLQCLSDIDMRRELMEALANFLFPQKSLNVEFTQEWSMNIYNEENVEKDLEIPAEILVREPDALKLFKAAQEEGDQDFDLSRHMEMGNERAGTTILIDSFLGNKSNGCKCKMSQSASLPTFEIMFQTKHNVKSADVSVHQLTRGQEINQYSERKHLGNFLAKWHVRFTSESNTPLFSEIREQWCSHARQHSPWLRPLKIEVVYGQGSGDYHHPDVVVDVFYLGCMLDRGTFICQYTHNTGDIHASFEHDSKRLTVDFNSKSGISYPLRFVYEYPDFFDMVLVDDIYTHKLLYFFVKVPPRVRRADTHFVIEDTKWIRTTAFEGCAPSIIGNSSVICFQFGGDSEKNFNEIIRHFETSNTFQVYYAHVGHQKASGDASEFESSEYGTMYAMKSFFSLGMISTHRSAELLRHIKVVHEEIDEETLQRALYSLSRQLENDHFIDLKEAFIVLLNEEKNKRTKEEVPGTCKYVRRIYCTPTRLIFEQPELMFSNRILRQYGEEFCARIVFRDENYRKLNGTEANSSTDIAQRIIQVLSTGVQIGDRCYKFLACSNSQLRDHGCWLYAQDNSGNTGETIRRCMGDFRKIKIVAKYISRMGQCFSTSESALKVEVKLGQVEFENDIEGGCSSEYKPYCFSEGIGKMSEALRDKVCVKLKKELKPSAFQIRYGGCKGVLAVDPTLTGEKIVIRKSMKKFESDDCDLEIMMQSKPCRLFLNNQAITLLSGRGVPESVFIKLQEDMLYHLANMLFNETQAAGSLKKCVRNCMAFTMISESGISLTQEPFFKGMLKALYKHSLGHLKRKAHIEIPDESGRKMIGTLDETAELKYGQVFIQYSKDILAPQRGTIIHEGPVVITKFPALHPGDIRRFNAVDVSSLHHMIDCVVFPQTGDRPHPDEMAGSDLDGDEYFVTWMPELLIDGNVRPMHFPSSPPNIHYGDIKEEHMIKYISDYIKNDRVGVIANAHLAFADSEEMGIYSDVCIGIAKKFSKAIDFPKTGSCPELEKHEHPKNYPHFMNKRDKTGYTSERVLGQLYTQCRNVESVTWQQDVSDEYRGTQMDRDLMYPGYGVYIYAAGKTRDEYNHDLKTIMTQYGIEKESEVMSGCLISLSRRITERNERFDTERLVSEKIRNLRRKYRNKFTSEIEKEGKLSREEIDRKRYAKASAWYYVTYCIKDPELLSFPWVMSDVLAQLKKYHAATFDRPLDPVMSRLSNEIFNFSIVQPVYIMQQTIRFYLLRKHRQLKAVMDILVAWDGMLYPGTIDVARTIALVQHFEAFVVNTHGNYPPSDPSVIFLNFLAYMSSFKSKTSDFKRPLYAPINKISKKYIQRFCKEAERSYHKLALSGTLNCLFGRDYDEQIFEQQFTIGPILRHHHSTALRRCVQEVRKLMGVNLWYRPIRKGRSQFWFFTFSGSYLQYLELSTIIDAWGRNEFISSEPI